MKTLVGLVLVAALAQVVSPGLAAADEATAKKESDTLFFEAKRLMKLGRIGAACFKFEESLAKLDQLGTRLNLAVCYEQAGRPASAWRAFLDFADAADKAKDDRADYARQRAQALEPKVARLTIKAPHGAGVQLDGASVAEASVGTAMPCDPGAHEVVVTVEGVENRNKVTCDAATPAVVEVQPRKPPIAPALKPLPVVDTSTLGATTGRFGDVPPSSGSGRKTAAYVVGGVGVAALAVGAATSVMAVSKKNDAGCADDGKCPSQDAVDKLDSARSMGNVATVAVGVGLAAVATGAILYLTAPSKTEVHAAVGPGTGAVWVKKPF